MDEITIPAGTATPVNIKPLTRQELHETANERVHLITTEFINGFNFLSRYPKSITIFGGTHFEENSPEYQKARRVSERVVNELNYSVSTGGGPGIMEGANRGAFEANGESLGFTIELPHGQVKNSYMTDTVDFYYFFSRKVMLAFSAEAYLFFPGGYGTLDEFFEIVTLVQTGKIERVPMILIGSEFWNPLYNLLEKEVLSRKLIEPEDIKLFTITDDEDEIIDIIRKAPVRNGIKFEHKEALATLTE